MLKLVPVAPEHAELILKWRSGCPESLRTTKNIPLHEQQEFLRQVSSKTSNNYFYMIQTVDGFIGYCGIESIDWVNSRGEISLLLAPEVHGNGYGREVLTRLFEIGFMQLNLENMYGEAYYSNKNLGFWERMVKDYNGLHTNLPMTKYWLGTYWSSYYFTFNKTMAMRAVRLGNGS